MLLSRFDYKSTSIISQPFSIYPLLAHPRQPIVPMGIYLTCVYTPIHPVNISSLYHSGYKLYQCFSPQVVTTRNFRYLSCFLLGLLLTDIELCYDKYLAIKSKGFQAFKTPITIFYSFLFDIIL